MDQNKQRIQPGFLSAAAFSSGFPGLSTGAGSNVSFMSTLQQLSSLSAPILPGAAAALSTDLSQWAAQQQAAGWIDQAKVAAMLPTMYGMFTGVKGLDLTNTADILGSKAMSTSTASVTSTSTPSIFPNQHMGFTFTDHTRMPSPQIVDRSSVDSPAGPSSGNPSSIPSDSTMHEIDVGGLSQPNSQSQPCDLSLRPSPEPLIVVDNKPPDSSHTIERPVPINLASASLMTQPSSHVQLPTSLAASPPTVISSTSSFTMINPSTSSVCQPSTSTATAQSTDDAWPGIDITDLNFDLFSATNVKEKEAPNIDFDEMKSMFQIENGVLPSTSALPKPSATINTITTMAGPNLGPLPSTSTASSSTGAVPQTRKTKTLGAFSAANLATSSCDSHFELAEADNELERILSIVEERNREKMPPRDRTLDFLGGVAIAPGPAPDDPSLSPVQFTPPDSPSGAGNQEIFNEMFPPAESPPLPPPPPQTPVVGGLFPGSSTPKATIPRAEPKLFMTKDPVYKKDTSSIFARNKSNKLPVYKQVTKINIKDEEPVDKNANKDDEYSFTDEDDDITSLVEGKDKLSEEVQQRLARVANQGDKKNVYVPGVGYAVPKEDDLWRHVVPKKRFGADGSRSMIPSTTLLPPEAQGSASGNPDIVTLAESIRRRKKGRVQHEYCKAAAVANRECAKEEGVITRHVDVPPGEKPPIKLIIRIPCRTRVLEENNDIDEREERKRRKRKKKDKDREWEGSDRAKRRKMKKKHKKERRSSVAYESQLIKREDSGDDYHTPPPPPPPPIVEEQPSDLSMFSKKRRLMMQWQDAENEKATAAAKEASSVHPNGSTRSGESYRVNRVPTSDFNSDIVRKRLAKFGPADGTLPKGTFVVAKTDLFREDCALWRVDNQNLLQKYPPRVDPETKKISYRNSSTYSGWCDQIASGYLTVKITYLKQTRSEAVIEPEVPLTDLFPAIASEPADTSDNCVMIEAPSTAATDSADTDISFLLRDPTRLTLFTYATAMLHHVLTLEFFQEAKEKNDWNFLRAMTEVEKNNTECMEKLRERVKWSDKYEETVARYTRAALTDSDFGDVLCQACGARPVEKTVQLFGYEPYDKESLQSSDESQIATGSESPLPATEMLVCSACATASTLYHQTVHMRYHLLKRCEDKLELIGSEHPDYSPEKVVEKAKESAPWMAKIVRDYADMWKKIQSNDF